MAMHLASMVHGSGRGREAQHHHPHHLQHQQQQQPPNFYSQPPHQRGYMPTSAAASPYSHPQTVDYPYQRHPQSPPSPPVEEQKPLLPSISSLLGLADGEKATSETAGLSPKSTYSPTQPSPQARPEAHSQPVQQMTSRPEQVSHASSFGSVPVSHPRMALPPTPPMHPDSVVDGNQSPSTASNHSVAAPYFLGQSLNNIEPHQQRQNIVQAPLVKRQSVTSQVSMSPYATSPYSQSPYASSPGAASTTSYYSPESQYGTVGVYGQRSLPSNFQPHTMALPVPAAQANGSNVWQHHHYISASSQAAFPQSQDRYICSTCNKAFSRPSSLRIHSHSHTGEKPYKCPQHGCGKAFSVRSNMKRHERGCHASAGGNITT